VGVSTHTYSGQISTSYLRLQEREFVGTAIKTPPPGTTVIQAFAQQAPPPLGNISMGAV
jgi:hypothetical protein